MHVAGRVSCKGQVTIPTGVREALDIHEDDEVVFRVERNRAVLAKTPDFLTLAGSVSVPAGKRGTEWSEIVAFDRAIDRAAGVTRREP